MAVLSILLVVSYRTSIISVVRPALVSILSHFHLCPKEYKQGTVVLTPSPLLLASYDAACGVVDTYLTAVLLNSLWTAAK